MLMFLSVIDSVEDRDLLEQIYIRYKKELFYTAYDILRDSYEAEDVVQNAIIKLVDYLDQDLKVECNKTRCLLVIIVRSQSINIYNQKKNRKTMLVETYDDSATEDIDHNPENFILRMDNITEVAEALSKINKGYTDILTLKYTYEYTNGEIASMLGLKEDNVRQRLVRARKALYGILSGGDFHV